jgi:hypothetical protein
MTLNLHREMVLMQKMTTKELKRKYADLFGEMVNTTNRTWLTRRIAWRLQPNESGGLSERARTEPPPDTKRGHHHDAARRWTSDTSGHARAAVQSPLRGRNGPSLSSSLFRAPIHSIRRRGTSIGRTPTDPRRMKERWRPRSNSTVPRESTDHAKESPRSGPHETRTPEFWLSERNRCLRTPTNP